MFVYTSTSAFRPSSARKGSKQAATKPVTLNGTAIVRYTLTASEAEAFAAIVEPEARTAFLAGIERRTEMTGTKVSVSPDQLAEFQSRILALANGVPATAKTLALGVWASGIVTLADTGNDDSAAILDELFPEPAAEAAPENAEAAPAPKK